MDQYFKSYEELNVRIDAFYDVLKSEKYSFVFTVFTGTSIDVK